MTKPTLMWFRRDLRLGDHPGLKAALAHGGPVIPVFILDDHVAGIGAAPRWRFEQALAAFDARLRDMGSRLILRRGPAREVLEELIEQTGAGAVHWTRLYDPQAIERDSRIKSALRDAGVTAHSHPGHLIFEPWEVETKDGRPYRVYSPMWRAVKDREVAAPLVAPDDLPGPETWPASDILSDWALGADMRRGAEVVGAHCDAGEEAAMARITGFAEEKMGDYKADRDFPACDATSGMSEYLAYGEISPRVLWHIALTCEAQGKKGAEHFRKEVVWREFAYHLMYHTPELLDRNWRQDWDDFPWDQDEDAAVLVWKQGRTGVRFVDAALREMYVTGKMHNRARMIVASYLTKHMMKHWKIGMEWFAECLTDWDPAANAMGWQWVAGSGPDAAPYFRIFNPDTQLDKFDPDGAYQRAWIAEGAAKPTETALSYFQAVPRSWGLSAGDAYPDPVVDLADGRAAALAAYETRKS
jgi:deoxyribodipyrimidine photo-lyase